MAGRGWRGPTRSEPGEGPCIAPHQAFSLTLECRPLPAMRGEVKQARWFSDVVDFLSHAPARTLDAAERAFVRAAGLAALCTARPGRSPLRALRGQISARSAARAGGQSRWRAVDECGRGGSGGPEEAELPPNAKPTQYIARERSTVAEMLLSKGGEDVGTFGDRIAIVKGPNISHQENYDPGSGNTILSFSGVGSVAVDENDGSVLTGKVYRVGTPDRPDEGLSIIIDRNGQARAYPTSGN